MTGPEGFWQRKRVLVTGVSGFVGPYLAQALLDRGADVYGLVRGRADRTLSRGLQDHDLAQRVQFLDASLEDFYGVLRAVEHANPEAVFHLAAQSFVGSSFANPLPYAHINGLGTAYLLEAIRMRVPQATVVFAGSSEEYGLVFASEAQYHRARQKYGHIFPAPERLPELPVAETNPLRPMSPYATSKVYGDYLVRNYAHSFGLRGIVSRAFNHEGSGRGIAFVTSQIANQVVRLALQERTHIALGTVNVFRDWSHVEDIAQGYLLLAERGQPGDVYNLGSMRTNSVLSYLLLALEEVGYVVQRLSTVRGTKTVDDPAARSSVTVSGVTFEGTRVDDLMLRGDVEFEAADEGLVIDTDRGPVSVVFDPTRFRPSDVPILLSNCAKAQALGFSPRRSLREIVRDQINYYLLPQNRRGFLE